MASASFIFPIAYDWRFALHGIARIWEVADEVIVAVDSERRTWAGNTFEFSVDEFKEELEYRLKRWGCFVNLDKLTILQYPFYRMRYPDPEMRRIFEMRHIKTLSLPMQRETLERAWLSFQAKKTNWIVQLDADERLLDAQSFVEWLPEPSRDFDILANWIFVWKVIDSTALIAEPGGQTQLATRNPGIFYSGRRGFRKSSVIAPNKILHWSLGGRSIEEIEVKLYNWGHSAEYEIENFLKFYKSVTLDNYRDIGTPPYFGPGPQWERLVAVPLEDLECL